MGPWPQRANLKSSLPSPLDSSGPMGAHAPCSRHAGIEGPHAPCPRKPDTSSAPLTQTRSQAKAASNLAPCQPPSTAERHAYEKVRDMWYVIPQSSRHVQRHRRQAGAQRVHAAHTTSRRKTKCSWKDRYSWVYSCSALLSSKLQSTTLLRHVSPRLPFHVATHQPAASLTRLLLSSNVLLESPPPIPIRH